MVVLFDILSDPPGSLEINRRLFESGVHFINVFSFRRKCISIGKLTKDVDSIKDMLLDGREEDIPIFRRRTGGGAVLHMPEVDVCFAFTVENNHSVKRMFHEVSHTISRFLLRSLREENGVIRENMAIIRENGDIILGGNKVCGIAMARKHRFFLVEGAIILPSEVWDKNEAKLDKNKAKSDNNKASLRDIELKICFLPSSTTFQRSEWLFHREFAFELFEFLRSEVKKLCV